MHAGAIYPAISDIGGKLKLGLVTVNILHTSYFRKLLVRPDSTIDMADVALDSVPDSYLM